MNIKNNQFKKFGYIFTIEKENKCYKVSTLKYYMLVARGKTKKEAIQEALNKLNHYGNNKTKEAYNNEFKRRVHNRFIEYIKPHFKNIFGFDLPLCKTSLLFNRFAIDVFRFDKLAKIPNNISTYNYIGKIYGIKAKKLLSKII